MFGRFVRPPMASYLRPVTSLSCTDAIPTHYDSRQAWYEAILKRWLYQGKFMRAHMAIGKPGLSTMIFVSYPFWSLLSPPFVTTDVPSMKQSLRSRSPTPSCPLPTLSIGMSGSIIAHCSSFRSILPNHLIFPLFTPFFLGFHNSTKTPCQ